MRTNSSQIPLLLHGFLGCKEDWDAFKQYFTGFAIDWHSEQDILPFRNRPVIGYSMGGRIALKLRQQFSKVILISSNLGGAICRKSRYIQDENWANKLERLPLKDFIDEWYNQSLFASLRAHPNFSNVLQRRLKVDPVRAAATLRKYSVAKQPSYSSFDDQTFFIYGSNDTKYAKCYQLLPRSFKILNAGHAVHIEQPKMLAEKIQKLLQ